MDTANAFAEKIFLRSDNGAQLSFQGRMFAESTYFDEQTSSLTRIRLYLTDSGGHVYSIVSGAGAEKSRRFYEVRPGRETCRINDGVHDLTVPTDMLFASVFGLCGIDPARAEELRPSFEENLPLAAAE
ncbi:MAG: hypothetical protein LBP61_09985 [Desulfovibrio sp.]|jgi:hypothetical protein|nr:hypothetical protein [Desulfovibrio sp.]